MIQNFHSEKGKNTKTKKTDFLSSLFDLKFFLFIDSINKILRLVGFVCCQNYGNFIQKNSHAYGLPGNKNTMHVRMAVVRSETDIIFFTGISFFLSCLATAHSLLHKAIYVLFAICHVQFFFISFFLFLHTVLLMCARAHSFQKGKTQGENAVFLVKTGAPLTIDIYIYVMQVNCE